MNAIFSLLNTILPVSPDFQKVLGQQLKLMTVARKHVLLQAGRTSSAIYFIEEGIVRGYYLKESKDITTGFLRKGDLVISPLSFYTQSPSYEYLELLTDGKLWTLSYNQLQNLYNSYTELNYMSRVLTEQYYARSELRSHHLRMLQVEERYEIFLSTYPGLANEVSGKYIASFLGMSQETLSRIRGLKL